MSRPSRGQNVTWHACDVQTWRKERKDRKAGENAWLERHKREIAPAIRNSGQNNALPSFLSDRYSKLSSISTAKPYRLLRIREQPHCLFIAWLAAHFDRYLTQYSKPCVQVLIEIENLPKYIVWQNSIHCHIRLNKMLFRIVSSIFQLKIFLFQR